MARLKPTPNRNTKARRERWPGSPRPRIPAPAEESVIQRDADGRKRQSDFWLKGKYVGRVLWHDDGATPNVAYGVRNGRIAGHKVEYNERGVVIYDEPFVDGVHHGWAKQYDSRGRLLLASPFKHGTGTDFWCDEKGRLHEEHPHGKSFGWERWWNRDQRSVSSEKGWFGPYWHGISRVWTCGTLDADYPEFFIRNKKVSKRRYVAAAKRDSTLPKYRPEDDSPDRPLSEHFARLRRLVLQKSSGGEGPTSVRLVPGEQGMRARTTTLFLNVDLDLSFRSPPAYLWELLKSRTLA